MSTRTSNRRLALCVACLASTAVALQATETSPAQESTVAELQSFCDRALAECFANPRLKAELMERFPPGELQRLRDQIGASAAGSEETGKRVEFHTGREVVALRRELRQERRDAQADLINLQGQLAAARGLVRDLQQVRHQVQLRFRDASARLSAAEPQERRRLEEKVSALRRLMEQASSSTMDQAQGLLSRLQQAVSLLETHVAALRHTEDRLYWTAMKYAEPGLFSVDWAALWSELGELLSAAEPAREPPQAGEFSFTAANLFDTQPSVREALAEWLAGVADDLRAFKPARWTVTAAALVIALVLALWLRRYAGRRAQVAADRLTNQSSPAEGGVAHRQVGQRIGRLCWQLTHDAALPILLAVALWMTARSAELAEQTLLPIAWAVLTLVVLYVLSCVVRRLFAAGEARQRIVPCDDAAAAYYRRTAGILLILAVLTLPIAVLLKSIGTAEAIRALFGTVLKIGVLLTLLVFLARKDRVLSVAGAIRKQWLVALVAVLHPIMLCAVLALLVLQLLGYGVLVQFVGIGALTSIVVAVVIGGAAEYLCDLTDRFVRTGDYAPRLIKSLVRFAAAVVAIMLILRIWAGSAYAAWLDWRVAGLLVMAAGVALFVDRLVLAGLHTLQASGRMPPSAVHIIRRWARGMLAVMLILFIITLAGYHLENLWIPFSTIFAMLAIGFVAVWSVLSNVLATIVILVWRPFRVGERIEIQPDGIAGRVVDINFLFTALESDAGEQITVPNNQFMQKFVKRLRRAAPTPPPS